VLGPGARARRAAAAGTAAAAAATACRKWATAGRLHPTMACAAAQHATSYATTAGCLATWQESAGP
jgi:hypothetical protein